MLNPKKLKKLTPEQCIAIAVIVDPTIQWKLIQSKNKWNGFDLIGKDESEDGKCENIVQIDYSKDTKGKSRIRLYKGDGLEEYNLTEKELMKVDDYLDII